MKKKIFHHSHLYVYKLFKNSVKPHGHEWKNQFRILIAPILNPDVFPKSLLPLLANYFKNPKASTDSDIELVKELKSYDLCDDKNYIHELDLGIKFSIYKAYDDVTYQVSELSAGTLKSIEVGKRLVEVTVVDIPRNTTITAKLIGSNASGETDGGQIISGAPEIAECTNSICYVGLPWKVETGFFTPGSGVMSLQEKIGGKWVSIKSSKPNLGKSPYKKYPVGYEISLSYSAPGKHTYRLVIAPSKKLNAKSKQA